MTTEQELSRHEKRQGNAADHTGSWSVAKREFGRRVTASGSFAQKKKRQESGSKDRQASSSELPK